MNNKVLKYLTSLAITFAVCITIALTANAAQPAAPTGLTATNQQKSGNVTQGFYFDWSGSAANTTKRIYLYVSKNASFTGVTDYDYSDYFYASEDTYISYSGLEPGVTYYARIKYYDPALSYYECFSGFSNQISFKVPAPEMNYISATVKTNSIRLYLSSYNNSGYQVWRKAAGGKYQRLGNITESTYLDSGLKSKTKYTYKIRPYYYDSKTKKYIYGSYKEKTYTTSGSALKLNSNLVNGKKVKLTWSKVKGTKEYRIYRSAGSSVYDTQKDGSYNGYTNWELIKTIKKAGTQSYTDSKAKGGQTYSYKVEAVMTDSKQENMIYDTTSITTEFEEPDIVMNELKSDGKKYVKWNSVYGADGYVIEKRNANGKYVTYKKLGKTTTSITLPAAALGSSDSYQIRAYKGKAYSPSAYVYVDSTLPVVQNVSAAVTANGIKVSWSAVKGASYYRVYRTTMNSINDYNADGGYYMYTDSYYGSLVYTFSTATKQSNGYYDLGGYEYRIKATSVNDNYYPISENYYEGPKPGQTYTYYVVAYAADVSDNTLATSLGCKKIAKAAYTTTKLTVTPKLKTTKSSKKGEATIALKAKVSGADGYIIYRSTKKNGGYEIVGTTTKTSFTDKKLVSGKTYYYKVRAYKANESGGDVYSSYSNPSKIKIK